MSRGRCGVLDVGDRPREVRALPRRRRATAAADSNLRGAARCPTPVRPFADGPFRLPPSQSCVSSFLAPPQQPRCRWRRAFASAQGVERFPLDGRDVAVYNLVGTMKVEGGSGDRVRGGGHPCWRRRGPLEDRDRHAAWPKHPPHPLSGRSHHLLGAFGQLSLHVRRAATTTPSATMTITDGEAAGASRCAAAAAGSMPTPTFVSSCRRG